MNFFNYLSDLYNKSYNEADDKSDNESDNEDANRFYTWSFIEPNDKVDYNKLFREAKLRKFNRNIVKTNSASRLEIEKFFNSAPASRSEFRFQIVLPPEHDYIGETINGKHEGEGIVITDHDVIIGNFENNTLKNGVIQNKDNKYTTYVLDYKTVINIVGTQLYMIHAYNTYDWPNYCLFIAVYMDSTNVILYSNTRDNFSLSRNPRIVAQIINHKMTINSRLPRYEDSKWVISNITADFKSGNSRLLNLYNNYTGCGSTDRIVFDIDTIPDSIVNKPVMSTRFPHVLQNLSVDCVLPVVEEPEEETKTS